MRLNADEKKNIRRLEALLKDNPNYLDFSSEKTKALTHGYHTYPAMMIPQLANEFINIALCINPQIKLLFDPFMGSGTSIVEAITHKLDAYGKDINPLALLMTKAKSKAISPALLEEAFTSIKAEITLKEMKRARIKTPTFERIDFWFKEDVIKELQKIKGCINLIDEQDIKTFFLAAFSETVRYVSNSRNSEFKLYRLSEENLQAWNPNVKEAFYRIVNRNISGNLELYNELVKVDNLYPNVTITQGNSAAYDEAIADNTFDLLITSPPYGDSGTTVAYGQFSRLSLQWLDMEIDNATRLNQLDNIMLGGKVDKKIVIDDALSNLASKSLTKTFRSIYMKNEKRALEVLQFYIDLCNSLKEISRVMKPGSYQFWVVANRTVKDIKIPTDIIVSELFSKYGIKHMHSFYRNIPSKRMPTINSPTNISGNHSVTMTEETILMLKKV